MSAAAACLAPSWDALWSDYISARREQNELQIRELEHEMRVWHHRHGQPLPKWLQMDRVTALEHERMQVAAAEARQRLHAAIARQPDLERLWTAWQLAEGELVDAGRARREAEVHGG